MPICCSQQESSLTKYTPGQLREAVGIGAETYRHWRKVIRALHREGGHSPCYTPGDLLATSAIKVLSVDLGLRVGALVKCAPDLFRICNDHAWPVLERGAMVVDPVLGKADLQSIPVVLDPEQAVWVMPLRPLVEMLRGALLADGGRDAQGTLQFPPVAQPSPERREKAVNR